MLKVWVDCHENTTATVKPPGNATVEMQRITQPISQSRQIEKTLTFNKSERNNEEFKPSPHLETFYEFNKFPVAPALPEAKHIAYGGLPQWGSKSPESGWSARVKFPQKDQPYEYYTPNKNTGKSYNLGLGSWNNYEENVDHKTKKDHLELSAPERFDKKNNLQHNHQFDFGAPVSVHKEHGGFGGVEKPSKTDILGGSWKKIIKFLTAVIPIGLLISALTPTVITVTSVNGTQTRSRAEKSTNKFVSSLSYFNQAGCEDRILCELLLSASTSQNAEHHVQNLLDTFTNDGKAIERGEEMKRIFAAVKNQDCSPIICQGLKEKT